ncbi:MAG TPA: uroporphyrinogen-III synthase, partial [Gemmatirosa sp.]
LTARGARVDRVVAYRTLDAPPDALADFATQAAAGALDVVLVASPSAAGALVRALASAGVDPSACAVVCIGPTTADACIGYGLHVTAVAAAPHDDALITATLDCLTHGRSPV